MFKSRLQLSTELLEIITKKLFVLREMQSRKFCFKRSEEISYLSFELSKLRHEIREIAHE